MQVKVTVSRPGGKTGNSFSQSMTFKEVATMEELIHGVQKEFSDLFPRYGSLDPVNEKRGKKKKHAAEVDEEAEE